MVWNLISPCISFNPVFQVTYVLLRLRTLSFSLSVLYPICLETSFRSVNAVKAWKEYSSLYHRVRVFIERKSEEECGKLLVKKLSKKKKSNLRFSFLSFIDKLNGTFTSSICKITRWKEKKTLSIRKHGKIH